MPQKQRVTPEIILDSSFQLFRREGMGSINARSIARETKCSTQPVFSCFANLGIIKDELEQRAVQLFTDTLSPALSSPHALEDGCCAYLRFAQEDAKTFLHLFVETRLGMNVLFGEGGLYPQLLLLTAQQENLTEEKARELTDAVCLYANGLAYILAAKTAALSADEACEKLVGMLHSMRERIS